MSKVIAVPLALAGALGALGGWLWWTWWAPAPEGQVYDTPDGPVWFPTPFDPGIARDFGGTATYAVLGLVLGLLLGVVGAVVARNRAVAGLATIGLASILAAVVMVLVGTSQSPPDPQERADHVDIGTELPGHLHVTSPEIGLWKWAADLLGDDDRRLELPTPYLVWPVGALFGYLVVMLSLNARSEPSEHLSA
ncbi:MULTISPECIES: hypothetical protein [Nocardioides]|uniref:DUF2567 domain-containing protein n=1 Tax=Nocardioides vastitatis TaxID=2568655 RepID=A0ABW0ZGJ9_9ACTN|nr:hypothetical protein [Nocardioides sp.]THI96406.1 hypothetical protein E7Z54_17125 [Nocardioides sp.]